MKFSEHFGLHREQPELDFVDIDTSTDMPLFIDPYTLSQREDNWSKECTQDITSFFQTAVDAIRNNNHARARALLNNLSEPNETCLGLSRGRPLGRGVSGKQATDLYEKLAESQAVQTGLLSELADCELVIPGIADDKISDITTNIIRRGLIRYTQAQCKLHGIQLRQVASGPFWDPIQQSWQREYVYLPIVGHRSIILVPKATVRRRMALNHQEYYQHFVLNFLQKEHLEAGSSLVRTLRSGEKRVYKKDLREVYPLTKDFLYEFSRDHPEILEAYKRYKGDSSPIMNGEIEEIDERILARGMIQRLGEISKGSEQATTFHHLMIGVLEFLFYPNLILPRKEHEIHEGRKRIDISYTNAAANGLFYQVRTSPQTSAQFVMVECKNYSSDPENPELDQLSSRFSHSRGRLGLLVARRIENKDLFLRRCRDTVSDDRGYVIPLDDGDIRAMLEMIERGERQNIDSFLNTIYVKLLS